MDKRKPQKLEFYRQLGARIRKLRNQRKLSQDGLAKLVDLSRASLTNIERGRQHPSLYTFCGIVEHLKVEISELLPSSAAITGPCDLRTLADGQVRGDDELTFIETAIKGNRSYRDA